MVIQNPLALLWKDRCTVTEYQAYKKDNKTTGHREVVMLANQPCKLSFSSVVSSSSTNTAATVEQKAKLFLAKDVEIKPGSKITIVRDGLTFHYKNSGEPAIFSNHQEIMLELFERWA